MSADGPQTQVTVEQLRADFDGVFAEPAVTEHVAHEVFVAIRVGGDPYALPLDGLAGLRKRETWVSIPSDSSALLGLAGLGGTVVPVFRLPLLLGYTVPDDQLHWFAIWGQAPRVGLAFEKVEGTLRVDGAGVHPVTDNQQGGSMVRAVLQTSSASAGEVSRNVLDLTRIVDRVAAAARR